MNDADRYRLSFGPYNPTRFRIGRPIQCEIRGEVIVRGISDGRKPWRMTKVRGNLTFVICNGLARAIVKHPRAFGDGLCQTKQSACRLPFEWTPKRTNAP